MSRILFALPLILAAAPASADSAGTRGYTATPAAPHDGVAFVTRGTPWRCGATVCHAPRSSSRDQVICELAARQVGQLQAFTVDGVPLAPEKLARCNAQAK